MPIVGVLIVAGVVFGLCFLIDKGFTKTFRGQKEHASGRSVRLSKKYGSIGLILIALGVAAIFGGINGDLALGIGGGIVVLLGVGLVLYYMTFGIFYDDQGFVLTTFGKRSTSYRYDQIQGQLLYTASGSILIELHMKDGRSVGLQAKMKGIYPFLDTAFAGWCKQTGRKKENCDFHDPDNSLWFPTMEGK